MEDDKKGLRISLDDAENRVTKGEIMRRQLEGDLQRLKLALNDKETENQVCTVCLCYNPTVVQSWANIISHEYIKARSLLPGSGAVIG